MKLPWELNPDLRRERLIEIGHIIRSARTDALDLFDEASGDDNWVLGCRSYAWSKNRIIDAADEHRFEWLTIVDRSLEFVFKIGVTPVRVFRSDGDEPTFRFLRTAKVETRQVEFTFADEDLSTRLHWRFIAEIDVDNVVQRIFVVGLTGGGEARCLWDVPQFSETIGEQATRNDVPPTEGGVELPEPEVSLRVKRKADENAR